MSRALAALVLALGACEPAPATPPFALERVALPAIAALETEIERGAPANAAQSDAVAKLAAQLAGPSTSEGARTAAIDELVAFDTPTSVAHVVGQVERAPAAWTRAYAASALANSKQDQVVPRLLLRLKYEFDPAALIEIATTLGRFGNFAGIDALKMQLGSPSPDIQRTAHERSTALAAAVGATGDAELWWAWGGVDTRIALPSVPPSARHRLEIWKQIALLASSDSRAADDARFVLSHSAAWVVEPLCRALHEVDVATRVRAVQCLQGMGGRATQAGPTLVAALGDPALAPTAVRALGSIAYPSCIGEVARRLERGFDLKLRIAAAQALGPLNLPAGIEPLSAVVSDTAEPIELRQAAATSLLMLGRDDAAKFLVECLTLAGADANAAEAALDGWLAQLLTSPTSESVRTRWEELAGPPHTTPTPDEIVARQRARAALLAPELARLVR